MNTTPRPPGGLYFDPDGATHRDAVIRRELTNSESNVGGYATVAAEPWKHHATTGALAAVEAIRDQAQAAGELFGPALLGALLANPKGGLYDEQVTNAIRHIDADYRGAVDDHNRELNERVRLLGELLRGQDAYDDLVSRLDEATDRLRTSVVEVRYAHELAALVEELVTSTRWGGTKTSAAAKLRQARQRAEKYVTDRLAEENHDHG